MDMSAGVLSRPTWDEDWDMVAPRWVGDVVVIMWGSCSVR